MKIKRILNEFLASEKTGGFVLIVCTILSLVLTNTTFGHIYTSAWNYEIVGETVVHWINDGLMALFFLLIGLELKREFLEGQFQNIKNALLPFFAAVGGLLLPAGIHALFNYGTPTQAGAGIPMATDAAFALAVLSLVGKRAPLALKMLLLAIAVIDDLCAIIVIAVFYTSELSWVNLGISLSIFALLLLINRLNVKNVFIYLIGGIGMWYFLLYSGIHATISGVLLAIVLPYAKGNNRTPSAVVQHLLHKPVAFVILPLFALSNTAISLNGNLLESFSSSNSMGILLGLVVGKPLGVFIFSFLAVKVGIGSLHTDLTWKHVFGVGLLAGIGFTISIFVSLLAFTEQELINHSKITVLAASVVSGLLAFFWLNFSSIRKGNAASAIT